MAFTVDDFEDLTRLLEQRPEWRARLRELLLPRELLELPVLVRELSEVIRDMQARMSRVEVRLERVEADLSDFRRETNEGFDQVDHHFAQVDVRFDQVDRRFAQVDERFDQVDHHFAQVDERFDQVDRGFAQVDARLGSLDENVGWLRVSAVRRDTELGELKGRDMELRYRDRAHLFGHLISEPVPLSSDELSAWLRAQVQAGRLNPAEYQRILRVDIVFHGGDPADPEYLAVEVSWSIDEADVRRAVQRAALLRKAGVRARAAVAGWRIEPEAAALAERGGVARVIEEELDAEGDAAVGASAE